MFSQCDFIHRIGRRVFADLGKVWKFCIYKYKSETRPCNLNVCDENSNMVKILNVAEKNDAAKNIANIMSRGACQRRDGISKYNKIYHFDYMLNNQKVHMVMTSVSGHLLNYEFVAAYRGWKSCSPDKLFDAPVEKRCPDEYTDIKRTLEQEIRGSKRLIIWTDCDREGENIGFEIIKVCREVNPNIQIQRARFSEITSQSIEHAIRALNQPDLNTSNAVDVRQELDLRIGAAFTRFQTLRLSKVFPDHLAEKLISYGSCQFPTLGFVVERYKQVESFVPEAFWKIKVSHEQDDAMIEFSWKRGRLFSQPVCFVIFEKCLQNSEATVANVRSKPKSKWRPLPLDTVELEKLASRKLRINAKNTMHIAEKLYTAGYISYPRTETNMFPKDLDLVSLVEMQIQSRQWGGFAQNILTQGPNPRHGTKSDQAHPPIHPTKFTASLSGDEKKIYEFIVRHFLAGCSKDAVGQETTVDIEISEEQFSANGLMILERNYLDVYPYDKWNAKVIPCYSLGQKFTPTHIEMPEGETSPPSLLTESELIALMDKHGIGTDATHAEHIEKIKSRMYVGVRDDGRFVPGELGMGLVEGYDLMGFEMSKPYLRAELEADLKRICQGAKDPKAVLDEQVCKYKHVFNESIKNAKKLDEALSKYLGVPYAINQSNIMSNGIQVVRPCFLCEMEMGLKQRREGNGFYVGCMSYPNCKASMWLPSYVEHVSVTDSICPECDPGPVRLLRFKFKPGSMRPYFPDEYTGCIGGCNHMFLESLGIIQSTRTVRSGDHSDRTRVPSSRNDSRPSGARSFSMDSGFTSLSSRNGSRSSHHDVFKKASCVRDNSNDSPPAAFQLVGRSNSSTSNNENGTPFQRTTLSARNEVDSMFSQRPGSSSASTNQDQQPANLVCLCGEDALLLTVRKTSKNQGRQFYKCARQGDGACNFFEWTEAQEYDNVAIPGTSSNTGSMPTQMKCKCHKVVILVTVQKDGPNKGRQFYSCEKPVHNKCGFFQWADENLPALPQPVGNDNGRARIGKSKRKCTLCRQEGHTRRTCPQN